MRFNSGVVSRLFPFFALVLTSVTSLSTSVYLAHIVFAFLFHLSVMRRYRSFLDQVSVIFSLLTIHAFFSSLRLALSNCRGMHFRM